MKFVLATFNRDKARELKALLALPWLELVPLWELPGASAPAETGHTLEENALIKARAALALSGLPAIADDTGLEVDALDGAPGIKAARFAGAGASDAENVSLLLSKLEKIEPERRTARFRTVCAACFPQDEWMGGRADILAEGVLEGRITMERQGQGGFGYDPVFMVTGPERTLAELTLEEKNAFSHRARAVRDLARRLAQI